MVEPRRRGLTLSVPMELSIREMVELRLRGSTTWLGLICYAGNPVCTYYVQGYVQGYSQKWDVSTTNLLHLLFKIKMNRAEAEFEEFEPRLKLKQRLKYGWFHLK